MTVEFLLGNERLPMAEGIPVNYRHYILHGGHAYYCKGDFGSIIMQQVQTELAFFRILHIHFDKILNIRCNYRHDGTVLFSRTTPEHSVTEMLKGGGPVNYDQKQFTCLFGINWQSLIRPRAPGDYIFYDTGWKEELFRHRLRKEMIAEMENSGPGFPNRIAGRRFYLTFQMNALLYALFGLNYSAKDEGFFHGKIDKYLAMVLNRMINGDWDMLGVKPGHWDAVERARQYIINNPGEDFTIPWLSEYALASPTNLKKYFQRITGFTIDNFRAYQKLRPALHILSTTNKQVKDIYETAYYNSASAFCAGFKNILLCSPTEIRTEEWETESL